MKAIVMHSFGGPEELRIEDIPVPTPQAGEALVRVAAVEVSRTRDVATRTGRHPFSQIVQLPHVLGGDFAGTVEAVGSSEDESWVGARVAASSSTSCGRCRPCERGAAHACESLRLLGIHTPGSYAEYTVVPVANLIELPSDLGFVEAAALAATGPIAHMQLRAADLAEGDSFLVTGASGALASVLLLLGQRQGAKPIGLSRDATRSPLGELGVQIIDGSPERITDALVNGLGGAALAAVIDNVADPVTFSAYLPLIRSAGTIVISGAIGSPGLPTLEIPAAPFYIKSLSMLGIRSPDRRAYADFWRDVENGFRLPERVLHTFPLAAAGQAHADVQAGVTVGHTILTTAVATD